MAGSNEAVLTLRIARRQGWIDYGVSVPSDGYLLDALEQASRQDPTLLFRHSCHHGSCGSCGVRVNGREKLACLTSIKELVRQRKPIRLEPLRNFPIIGDLLVEFQPFLTRLAAVGLPAVREDDYGAEPCDPTLLRFENCIECGLCVSACPIAGSDPDYWGPAALAAANRLVEEPRGLKASVVLGLVNSEQAVWRCHTALECSEVCPAGVDPGKGIFSLRRKILEGGRQ